MNGLACAQRFESLSERNKDQIIATLDLPERLELLYWMAQYVRQTQRKKRGTKSPNRQVS